MSILNEREKEDHLYSIIQRKLHYPKNVALSSKLNINRLQGYCYIHVLY